MHAIEKKLRKSFQAVKRDINSVRDAFVGTQENIKKLDKNQKVLLDRLAKLESKLKEEKKQFVGAKSTQKVHDPACAYGKNIKGENRVYFPSIEAASKQGYNVCTCLK